MVQTYVVRFNDKRISEHLSSGLTVRKIQGKEDIIEGNFKNRPFPDTMTTVAVRKEHPTNRPMINISQENLDKIVPYFNFIDTTKDERIEKAKIDFGIDAFWNHPDLLLEIKNNGTEITVDDDPTKTPIDFFWFSVMKSDPDFFIEDGTQRRPETMSEVKFIVQPKYQVEKTIKTEFVSLAETRDTIVAIISMTREMKKYVIDHIGENLYHPDKSSDKDLENIILENLDKSRNRRLENGIKFGDFIESITKQSPDQFFTAQNVKYAIGNGIITKSGDLYYYDNMPCGSTQKETEDYFQKSENKKYLTSLEININKLKKNK